jgi:hypothetical protein
VPRPARGTAPTDEPESSAVFVARKGFTKCAWDELKDDRLTGDELQLLLRARYVADRDETDGLVPARAMKALAVLHGIAPARHEKALRGLIRKGRIRRVADGFVDIGFQNVCQTAAERKKQREDWRRWKGASRSSTSGPDTSPESGPESGRVSATSEAEAEAESESRAQAAARSANGAAAEVETADEVSRLAALWCELTGKLASGADVAVIRSWKGTFGHRLSDRDMATEVRTIWQRQVARGDPPKHLAYFTDAISELYERRQRNRPVRGVNEPPEPEELPL